MDFLVPLLLVLVLVGGIAMVVVGLRGPRRPTPPEPSPWDPPPSPPQADTIEAPSTTDDDPTAAASDDGGTGDDHVDRRDGEPDGAKPD